MEIQEEDGCRQSLLVYRELEYNNNGHDIGGYAFIFIYYYKYIAGHPDPQPNL